MERIWIDVSSLRQVNLLSTLALKVSKRFGVSVTSVPDERVARVLRGNGILFSTVDGGGPGEIARYANRILALKDRVGRIKPDILVSDLDPAAVRTAFGLGIPVWTFYRGACDPRQSRIQRMTLPLCEHVFVSEYYPESEAASAGLIEDQMVRFRGWNECYLLDEPWCNRPRNESVPSVLLRSTGDADRRLVESALGALAGAPAMVETRLGSEGDGRAGREGAGKDVSVSVDPPAVLHDLYIGSGRTAAEFFVVHKPVILLPGRRHSDLAPMYGEIPEVDDQQEIESATQSLLANASRRDMERRSTRITRHMRSPMAAFSQLVPNAFSP